MGVPLRETGLLVYKIVGIMVGQHGESCRCHFSQIYEPSASLDVVPAPVASFASGSEMLDRFTVVNAFLRAVYPAEAQCHLHSIYIPDNARIFSIGSVYTNPEARYLVVVGKIPSIEFFSGVYVKQICDFLYARLFQE